MQTCVQNVSLKTESGDVPAYVPTNNALYRVYIEDRYHVKRSDNNGPGRLENIYKAAYMKASAAPTDLTPFRFHFSNFNLQPECGLRRRQIDPSDVQKYIQMHMNIAHQCVSTQGVHALHEMISVGTHLTTQMANFFKQTCIPMILSNDNLTREKRAAWSQFMQTTPHIFNDKEDLHTFQINALKFIVMDAICQALNRNHALYTKDDNLNIMTSFLMLSYVAVYEIMGEHEDADKILRMLIPDASRTEAISALPMQSLFLERVNSLEYCTYLSRKALRGVGANNRFITSIVVPITESIPLVTEATDILWSCANLMDMVVLNFCEVGRSTKEYIPQIIENELIYELRQTNGEYNLFWQAFTRWIRSALNNLMAHESEEVIATVRDLFMESDVVYLVNGIVQYTNIFAAWNDEIVSYLCVKKDDDKVVLPELYITTYIVMILHKYAQKFYVNDEMNHYDAFGYMRRNILTHIHKATAYGIEPSEEKTAQQE